VAVAARHARPRPTEAAESEAAESEAGETEAAESEAGDLRWRQAAGVTALVFAAVPAVRASGVLAVACLIAAFVLGAYALLGGRSWAAVFGGAAILLGGAAGGLGWLVGLGRGAIGRARRIALAVAVTVGVAALLVAFLHTTEPGIADRLDA
jgi:hypothetical protein